MAGGQSCCGEESCRGESCQLQEVLCTCISDRLHLDIFFYYGQCPAIFLLTIFFVINSEICEFRDVFFTGMICKDFSRFLRKVSRLFCSSYGYNFANLL